MTKIGPFFVFILHFSIFLFEIWIMVSHLSCEAKVEISIKNIENIGENRRKGQSWSYLDWYFLAQSLSR